MKDRRLLLAVVAGVVAVWLLGTWVTRYSLEQMAYLAPIAVVVVGAQIGLIMLWVKIIRQSRSDRRAQREAAQ